ncbi:dihydroxyacetone kinase subunit DhaL [Mycoplasmopsis ciconiae]|uniref:Dihydroxyacetone kinase subunit DhaL n=1 Tax=Mycoplasmopsis ciconiae TaxID=561067 RepID=A0ABU7MLS8_9BACT|nr:dihydroxyacetone kinase subunit DhaL [Mycoplasmopsis ciconiae]
MDSRIILQTLDKIADKIDKHADELTELDRLIGDGDHGINLKRGFDQIKLTLPTLENKTSKEIFNNCAMICMTKVGGSSGPLLATAFMKMAASDNFADALMNAANGIKERGRANVGEKTMLDILMPYAQTYNEQIKVTDHKNACMQALKVAKEHLEHSKEIKATKGRASYLGERSIGVTDPGSQSMFYILEVISESAHD